jgi:uncharacterized lipoprotein YajG
MRLSLSVRRRLRLHLHQRRQHHASEQLRHERRDCFQTLLLVLAGLAMIITCRVYQQHYERTPHASLAQTR